MSTSPSSQGNKSGPKVIKPNVLHTEISNNSSSLLYIQLTYIKIPS